MKKIALFLSALAMLVACEKEEGGIQQNAKVTIGVNHEQVTDGVGRVAISETGNKFALSWEGIEELLVTTSTNGANGSWTNAGSGFEMISHDGASATFTGELPDAGADVSVTDYFAAVSSFMSRTTSSGRNHIRLAIATNQTMNDANIANSCMLIGEQADCAVGVIPSDFLLKTMNAFIKIPVTKGAAANGSTNTYVNGMKLQSVKIEAIGEEQLAGRFAFDLSAADWSAGYATTNTGLDPSVISSSVTLNCDNLALTNEATNLYVAVAFGTYSQGLKVTFTVVGDNDKTGEMVRTIGGSGITIARNTMLSMPPVAVTPTDIATEKYQLISRIADLTAGTYYMAGLKEGSYCLATGAISSGSGGYLRTTQERVYNTATQAIDVEDAAEVVLQAVGGSNEYYIKIGDKYLTSASLSNNKMKLADSSANNPYWTAANDNRGGIVFCNSVYEVYLISPTKNTGATGFLRSYTDNTLGSGGVHFFKKL